MSARSSRPVTATSLSPFAPASPAPTVEADSRKDSGAAIIVSDERAAHALRSSRSRMLAGEVPSAGPSQVVRRTVSGQGLRQAAPYDSRERASPSPPWTPDSSDDGSSEDGEHRYGRPLVSRTLGGYAAVSASDASPSSSADEHEQERGLGLGAWDPVPDADLNTFAAHFRALVAQVARDTDAAQTTAPAPTPSSPRDAAGDSHFVLGRTIHRMPTIESMGSHEVVSLASGARSRRSTRSNTLSTADAPHSRSASRANSLDAALTLTLQLDGLVAAERAQSEFGELTPSSATSTSYSVPFGLSVNGSRSTGTSSSYHTAMSVRPESIEEGS